MNLILVIIDSLRQDHVGAYGNAWIKTPNLDRFAAESVIFTRAYPESQPTLPFRRSLLTGKRVYPFAHWEPAPAFHPFSTVFGAKGLIPGWNPLPAEDATLAERLQAHGFVTGLITDCFHQHYPGMNFHRGYNSWEFIRGQEWDCWKSDARTGMDRLAEKYMTERMRWEKRKTWELGRYLLNNASRQSEEDYFPAQVFRSASRWVEKNYQAEKLFLCVDCFDPHEPWDPPQYYRDLYDPGYQGVEVIMPLYHARAGDYLTPAELKHMRALYAAEVTLVDHWFGHFMTKVRLLGLDKNSVIVVISDHGHQLGEKDFTGKLPWGQMPCLLDLVCLIRHPQGLHAGRRIDAFTQNQDVLPTVMGLLGLPIPEEVEGQDLWPVVGGRKDKVRDHVTSCFKDYFWVRDETHALVARSDKTEIELYDLRRDPLYLTNIAADHPALVERMWGLILQDAHGQVPVYNVMEPLLERAKGA